MPKKTVLPNLYIFVSVHDIVVAVIYIFNLNYEYQFFSEIDGQNPTMGKKSLGRNKAQNR